MVRSGTREDEFSRLHRLFQYHLGMATALAWTCALVAAWRTPWVRDIYHLIDPLGPWRAESTGSYLFGFPTMMTLAWISSFLARDLLYALRLRRHVKAEFAVAGAVGFLMFYMSIERAVTALLFAAR
jgi:hypothetical protein